MSGAMQQKEDTDSVATAMTEMASVRFTRSPERERGGRGGDKRR